MELVGKMGQRRGGDGDGERGREGWWGCQENGEYVTVVLVVTA